MAQIVIVMGESGSGKSASLRNFSPEEISILNATSKLLPFRNKIPKKDNCTYEDIAKALSNPTKKAYVIDDAGPLLAKENFARAQETGYGKFTMMAQNFYNMLEFINTSVPSDIIVYLMMHTEETEGFYKVKTLGKMLDSTLGGGIESLVTICLRTVLTESGHKFITGEDTTSTAKSPMGLFEDKIIDNDLKLVDTAIREYYELPPLSNSKKKGDK